MKKIIFCVSLLITTFISGRAQTNFNSNTSSVVGTWKGTSICQVKNSSCHDEIAVYHISKGKADNIFNIQGSRIANGAEVDMGTLVFRFDPKTNQLISNNYGTWVFNVKDKAMAGTLTQQGTLFRVIKLVKQE